MPFVTIKMIEGRSQDQKDKAAREITEVVSKTLDAPKEKIFIIFEEMSKKNYAPHGELLKK